jgi:hypothetical protein
LKKTIELNKSHEIQANESKPEEQDISNAKRAVFYKRYLFLV